MHKLSIALLSLLSVVAVAGEKLSIATTPVPQSEILEFVKPKLAAEGVDLDIQIFNDYVLPNMAVQEKQVDLNFFQHLPYLDEFNASKGTTLVAVAAVHVEPMGAYSHKVKTVADLAEGATVAIPDDATNGARALLLLAHEGLITLKDPKNLLATARDVVENPKKLKFKELEAAMLPRVLDEVDLAVINANYALDAKLDPIKEAILIEDANSPYANFIVSRPDNKDSDAVKKLVAALHSEEVKTFIKEKYKGAVVPAF